MKSNRLPYILLMILLLPVGYLASTMVERYEEEVDLGWSLEARRNPYLAAEQFLQQGGTKVESSYQLDVVEQLSPDASLFISDANAVLNERRADALIRWMEAGGQVIIGARVLPDGQKDVFLDRFGVRKYSDRDSVDFFELADDSEEPGKGERENEEEDEEKRLSEILLEQNQKLQEDRARQREKEELKEEGKLDTVADEIAFREEEFDPENIMTLRFDNVAHEFRIVLDRDEFLSHPAVDPAEYEPEFAGEYQGQYQPFYWRGGFMQFEVEEGLLTVLSDPTIWTSDRIGLFDHAFLLSLLTESSDNVVFLYGAMVPSLFELLWRHFFELCVVLLLILATWLLYRARRFGPILDTSDLSRRSFREHLSAVGDFFWRHKQRDNLLVGVRESIWNQLRAKHFAVSSYSESEKLAKLAELVNESPRQLHALMIGPAPDDEFTFVRTVRSLQKIRKQL